MSDDAASEAGSSERHNHQAGTRRQRRKRAKRRARFWLLRDVIIIVVIAIVVSALTKAFLVRSFYVPSGSMENTLLVNDRIIVNELVPKVVGISRGDVVVFRDPGGWLPEQPAPAQSPLQAAIDGFLGLIGVTAPDSNNHLVKRVIGLPGDRVTCCTADGKLSVNGVPVTEPYVHLPAGVMRVAQENFDVTVPAGSLWVMGDNRYNSSDSRVHQGLPSKGFVPESDVVGRAFVISWPSSRWTWLSNYPEAFHDVPKPAT